MTEATTTHKPAQLVSAREVRGATVKLGWCRRERVFVYGYDDGRYVVGYPLRVGRDSYGVVELAEFDSLPLRRVGRVDCPNELHTESPSRGHAGDGLRATMT